MEEEEATVLILICGVSTIAVEGIRQTRLSYMTWLTPGPSLCHLLIFLHNVWWSALFLLPVSTYLKLSTWFCLSCFLSVLSNLLEKPCSFHSFFSSIALRYRCKHVCVGWGMSVHVHIFVHLDHWSLNPFTAPSCKISGLKSAHIHACKQYI